MMVVEVWMGVMLVQGETDGGGGGERGWVVGGEKLSFPNSSLIFRG